MNNIAIKNIRNLSRLTKENQATKDRIIGDIWNLPDQKNMVIINQQEQVIFGSEIILNVKKNGEYFNKNRAYLKDIMNDFQKYNT